MFEFEYARLACPGMSALARATLDMIIEDSFEHYPYGGFTPHEIEFWLSTDEATLAALTKRGAIKATGETEDGKPLYKHTVKQKHYIQARAMSHLYGARPAMAPPASKNGE